MIKEKGEDMFYLFIFYLKDESREGSKIVKTFSRSVYLPLFLQCQSRMIVLLKINQRTSERWTSEMQATNNLNKLKLILENGRRVLGDKFECFADYSNDLRLWHLLI